ncbi:MAG TPA: hypothetical protein VII06_16790 [Chloroflexota bacterium]|jgi:hypothetical protein
MAIKDQGKTRALRVVRDSHNPVQRARAFVSLGREAHDKRKAESLLQRALDEASHASEPYLAVWEAASALRTLLGRGLSAELSQDVDRLMAICDRETNPIRRGDALWVIASAIEGSSPGSFRKAIDACAAAFLSAHGYLRDYRLKRLAISVNRFNPEQAVELAQAIHRPRERRRAFQAIGHPESV